MPLSNGTHMGRLSPEARAIRAVKNARCAARSGQAERPPGSSKRVHTRLHLRGNRQARGIGR